MSYASQAVTRTSGSQAPARPDLVPTAQQDQRQQLFHPGMQQQARAKDGRTELELLRDTRRTLAETDTIASSTCVALDGQTEQIERIQNDAEKIDANLDQSEYLLRGLKPFGWVRNLFRKEPKEQLRPQPEGRRTSQGSANGYTGGAAPPAPVAVARGAQRLLEDEERRKNLKLGSASKAGSALSQRPDLSRQAEVDAAYDDIDNLLDGLKEKGRVINRTLDQHNQMLPDTANSISRNQERISKQQQELKKRMG